MSKGRALELRVTGWTGFADTMSATISKKWFARRVARKLMRDTWKGVDPAATDIILHFPFGTYRVVNRKGKVEPFTGQLTNLGTAGF